MTSQSKYPLLVPERRVFRYRGMDVKVGFSPELFLFVSLLSNYKLVYK
jgi:hypothetical protein